MKTAELTGASLDWAVAKCEGRRANVEDFDELGCGVVLDPAEPPDYANGSRCFAPSRHWHQGGPIIEREKIDLENTNWSPVLCYARKLGDSHERYEGPTLLIAAMRCYVASKLGDEVDVPEELL